MAECTAERLNDIMGYEMQVYLNVAIVQYCNCNVHNSVEPLAHEFDHILCIEATIN